VLRGSRARTGPVSISISRAHPLKAPRGLPISGARGVPISGAREVPTQVLGVPIRPGTWDKVQGANSDATSRRFLGDSSQKQKRQHTALYALRAVRALEKTGPVVQFAQRDLFLSNK
jgi:hypothetical protein